MVKTKKANIKEVIVKTLTHTDSVKIDINIFDDPYLEAATRVIENHRFDKTFKVSVIVECYFKNDVADPMKHFIYNVYYILVNAALYEKAEKLRTLFKQNYGVDLKFENMRGEETNNIIKKNVTKNSNEFPFDSGDFINN
jgi:hypothetical protein